MTHLPTQAKAGALAPRSLRGWVAFAMICALAAAFGVAARAASAAPSAFLLADLSPGRDPSTGSDPQFLFATNDAALLTLASHDDGRELWLYRRASGTVAPLASLCPGACTGPIEALQTTPGGLYLSAGASAGLDLPTDVWFYDAASETVRLVRSFLDAGGVVRGAGAASVGIAEVALFFVELPDRRELWSVRDPDTGAERLATFPFETNVRLPLEIVPGHAAILATDAAGATALWWTDSTRVGTRFVRLLPLRVDELTMLGARAVFVGRRADTPLAFELWTSDGTFVGTRRLAELGPALSVGWPQVVSWRAFFVVSDAADGDEIWSTDGTAAGSGPWTSLADPAALETIRYGSPGFAVARESLLFVANEGGSRVLVHLPLRGGPTERLAILCADVADCLPWSRFVRAREWIYLVQETVAGVRIDVVDARGPTLVATSAFPPEVLHAPIGTIDDALVVPSHTPELGDEVWLVAPDGVARPVTDFAEPQALTFGGGTWRRLGSNEILLSAWEPATGSELWRADPTTGATSLVADLGNAPRATSPRNLLAQSDFASFRGSCAEPFDDALCWFRTEAASWESRQTSLVPNDADCYHHVDLPFWTGEYRYYTCRPPFGIPYLYSTDGRIAETLAEGVSAEPLAVFGSRLWYRVFGGADGEAWSTSGTSAKERTEFELPFYQSYFQGATSDRLLFAETEEESEQPGLFSVTLGGQAALLWSTSDPCSLTSAQRVPPNRSLLLSTFSDSTEAILVTDGTPGATIAILCYSLPKYVPNLESWSVHSGRFYFVLSDPGNRRSLWTSDGSVTGTRLLFSFGENESLFVEFEGNSPDGAPFLFVVADAAHGHEIWTSDGTPAGTRLFVDLAPGPIASYPSGLVWWNGRAYFVATTPGTGREIWSTDGTAEGTRLEFDLAPGPVSSDPSELTRLGDRILFAADDGIHGRELWAIALDEEPKSATPGAAARDRVSGSIREDRIRPFSATSTP